jgi:hypothetical protein
VDVRKAPGEWAPDPPEYDAGAYALSDGRVCVFDPDDSHAQHIVADNAIARTKMR